jgi:hypothetical protein
MAAIMRLPQPLGSPHPKVALRALTPVNEPQTYVLSGWRSGSNIRENPCYTHHVRDDRAIIRIARTVALEKSLSRSTRPGIAFNLRSISAAHGRWR